MKKSRPINKTALLPIVLLLGGCLSDQDTAGNRSVLPPASSGTQRAQDREMSEAPRQLCESTMEGNEPRTVCY